MKDQSENSAMFAIVIQSSLCDHSAIYTTTLQAFIALYMDRKELVAWRPIQKSRQRGQLNGETRLEKDVKALQRVSIVHPIVIYL